VVVWESGFILFHGEPMGTEFPSCFPYNPKYSASRLLCLPTCFHTCILLGLFDPEDIGDVPPKHWSTFIRLHGVIDPTCNNPVSLVTKPSGGTDITCQYLIMTDNRVHTHNTNFPAELISSIAIIIVPSFYFLTNLLQILSTLN
jgi:hypothetical protein